MKLLEPFQFADYELIDSGEQEKLERFGKIILSRPEPQAVWDKSLNRNDWDKSFNARFIRKKGNKEDNFEKGEWQIRKDCPQQWFINYKYKSLNLKFRLGLTSFGHIGIFPEQAANWNYIHDFIAQIKTPLRPKVLNLFAYTGIASMVAKKAGADVYHVDSVKQVINWANEIAIANNLQDIHWVVEDAMKFVKREVKRGNKYNGIILDPPAYGRGPEGEKWLLTEHINELLKLCSSLLADKSSFFILNLYSIGFSALIANNLVNKIFNNIQDMEYGELYLPDKAGNKLPLGVFARFAH